MTTMYRLQAMSIRPGQWTFVGPEGPAMKRLAQCLDWVKDFLNLDEPVIYEEKITDQELLQAAAQELDNAQRLLAEVTEPDLVDYAIYRLKAAERRYDYLYKLIKHRHLKSE